jgi:isoquinoline 1-oxidoreductase subunit beta
MTDKLDVQEMFDGEHCEADEAPDEVPGLRRREFVQLLGAGLLLTVTGSVSAAEGRRPGGFGGGGPTNVAARIHLGKDGAISAMAGKVALGQGARAELTQAAAEELRVAADRINLILADTAAVPNDGVTAGSQTTPRTVPAMRKAAAAAHELLVGLACKRWQVDRSAVEVKDGVITDAATKNTLSYADLAKTEDLAKTLAQAVPADVSLTPVKEWSVLGTSLPRPNRRDLVTGAHRYPSDVVRPGMLYGKVLRPPSYGATLTAVDLAPAKEMEGVVVVRDGAFVGCAAPTLFRANQALAAIAKTATWQTVPQPSSKDLFPHLKKQAQGGRDRAGGGGRARVSAEVPPDEAAAGGGKVLNQSYEIAYIQHVPMEPRAGAAEWSDGKLTAWASTANPFGVRGELASALQLPADQVRVIVPDVGCAFGGKHQCEAAVEAARLAKAAGRPVAVHWTREEEFTWAYFRPAGLIEVRGELDAQGGLVAWDFTNINSGGAAIDTPYEVAKKAVRSVGSNAPLRQGSYRALAATANNFAREAFMDELALAAGSDPLAFRLAHLKNPRLRTVLETAAARFGWAERTKHRAAGVGLGLACGTEKGSYVAACIEVAGDRQDRKIQVRRICEVFECGAILNPANLLSQVQGCILMGLGGALREEIRFEDGKILNAALSRYEVPRFKDVPELDIHLLNRPDLEPAGGGETPIIAVAPAIANAVFSAAGVRVRSMPIRLKA